MQFPWSRSFGLLWLVLFGVCLCAHSPAQADQNSWPGYGGPGGNFSVGGPALGDKVSAKPLWRRPLGPGTSGVVGDSKALFTLYSVPEPKAPQRGEEVVVAIDPATGKTVWEHRYPVARIGKQQSFSGDPIRPQATPAWKPGRLFTLGYTGLVKAFDTRTGKTLWEVDLVKDWEATPVQFGFSASPWLDAGRLIVPVGGKRAALVALDEETGKCLWQSEPAEPAYATPCVATLCGQRQWIHLTRDHLLGISDKDGKTLWKMALPQGGLTNVPTPLCPDGNHVLISGQGANGTRLYQIGLDQGVWSTREVWANTKERTFYCNWILDGDRVIANNGNFLLAWNWRDGKELWRQRGQNDSNQIRAGGYWWILRGDGKVSVTRLNEKGIQVCESFTPLDGRCWTSPTWLDGRLISRDQKDLAAWKID